MYIHTFVRTYVRTWRLALTAPSVAVLVLDTTARSVVSVDRLIKFKISISVMLISSIRYYSGWLGCVSKQVLVLSPEQHWPTVGYRIAAV